MFSPTRLPLRPTTSNPQEPSTFARKQVADGPDGPKELLERETGREGIAVLVRPELVVEISLDGVQSSTRYPGGVALRFARVKRYRPDKSAAEADTIDHLCELLVGRHLA